MSAGLKSLLGFTMTVALLFGFLDPLWPEAFISFKRLHIFLFNLVSGGTLLIYHVEESKTLSRKGVTFLVLSFFYALSAALDQYWLTLLISFPLFLLLESIRIRRFSLFPMDFFRLDTNVSDKFLHAALLCLSIGVVIASLVIVNNFYLHLIRYEKLTLNVFFLGYSFPLSLVTMSLMFSFMKNKKTQTVRYLEEAAFWLVNLGVIIFFLFIIVESLIPEITSAMVLFITVCVIFYLFLKNSPNLQQTTFLISGMSFLLLTGLTGIFYILRYFFPSLQESRDLFLTLHSTVALYGWNLSGLIIIIRKNDFPIQLNTMVSIVLHWIIVLVLAPMGKTYPIVAAIALPAYALFLGLVFLSNGTKKAHGT